MYLNIAIIQRTSRPSESAVTQVKNNSLRTSSKSNRDEVKFSGDIDHNHNNEGDLILLGDEVIRVISILLAIPLEIPISNFQETQHMRLYRQLCSISRGDTGG